MAEEKKTEDTRTFAERLAYVQKALKAPKSRYNKFGDYNYRNLEDIFEGVKEFCADNGLLLVVSDQLRMEGDWHYIEATARVYDTKHFPEVFIENKGYARETLEKKKSDAAQITGAASSYARKYALNGLFLIDDTKTEPPTEIDSEDHTKNIGRGADRQITESEARVLKGMVKPAQTKWALDFYKVDDLGKLTQTQYAQFMALLKKKEEQANEPKSEN